MLANYIPPVTPHKRKPISRYYLLRNYFFYTIKPFLPRALQISIRRLVAKYKRPFIEHVWPIDPSSSQPPKGWPGWPGKKQFALLLSHDVETRRGYQNVLRLADIEEQLGFRSVFNFVPERYGKISLDLLGELKQRGFGIGLHGLKHDGKLFLSKSIFDHRAPIINDYLKKWGISGFTSPSMHHNLKWISDLHINYSMSTFDTDPFEPQPDGARTIFPFWVPSKNAQEGYFEIPYTLPQDSTLFLILGEKNNSIWKNKLDWISSHKGMALLNTHPDYMGFSGAWRGNSLQYPVRLYTDFLCYIKDIYKGSYYHTLPDALVKSIAGDFHRII